MADTAPYRRTVLSATVICAIAAAGLFLSTIDGRVIPSGLAQPCYNGVTPYSPSSASCTLPGPINKIRGSAPDANAIIACRHDPGCLAWYVNNP
jgi:hypothetical protein